MDQKLKFLLQWTTVIGIYLLIEWFYNQHLLALITYPEINTNQFETTEVFGKILAAFGINFVLKETIKYKGNVKFILGLILAYGGLTLLFNYFLDSAPNELRYTSYYSTAHRKDVIEKKDTDKLLNIQFKDWYSQPLMLASFYMTFDNNYWKKYEKDIQNNAKNKSREITLDKEKYYQDYVRAENGRKQLEDGWEKYLQAQYKLSRYQNTRYESRARNVFIEKVGLEPGLKEPQFYKIKGKEYMKFLDTQFFEGSENANLKSIYGKDIPKYMTKVQFNRFLDSHIENANVKLAPKVEQIKRNEASRNSLAIILIPPISLVLSFLSIVLNVFFLILLWVDYFLIKSNSKRILILIPAVIMMLTGYLYLNFTPKETSYYSYWDRVEKTYSAANPTLSFFWGIALKGEKLICPSGEPNRYVTNFTEKVYK